MGQFFSFLLDHYILTSAFIVLLGMLIYNELRGRVLGYKDTSVNDVVKLINNEDALVIDVREEGLYESGHIVNALNIPVALMDSKLAELEKHRDKPIIVVCRTGQVSARGCVELSRKGFKNLHKLKGGMLSWLDSNMPTVKD